jgi:hypothetical protein
MENESTKASKKGENGLNKCKFTKIIIQSSNKGTKKTNRSNLSIPEPEQPIKRRTSKAVLGFAIEKVATWRLMRIPKIAFPISLSVHQECFVKFIYLFFIFFNGVLLCICEKNSCGVNCWLAASGLDHHRRFILARGFSGLLDFFSTAGYFSTTVSVGMTASVL